MQRKRGVHPRPHNNICFVIDRLAQLGGRKWLLIAVLAACTFLLLLAGFATMRPADSRPKPPLGLMTSLPLVWSEGGIEADLAKDATAHPAFTRLSAHFNITPIDDVAAWVPNLTTCFCLRSRAPLRHANWSGSTTGSGKVALC
jgi:hypothetical protein